MPSYIYTLIQEKKMNYKTSLMVLICLMFQTPAYANLISNGSFEDITNFVDNGQNTMVVAPGGSALTGWQVVTNELAWIGPANPFSVFAPIGGGSYFLDLTSYTDSAPFAGVTQTIVTTAGQQYTLEFDLGSSSQYGQPVALQAAAGSLNQSFTSPLSGLNLWQHISTTFTATGPTTLISLQGTQGVSYIGLDNVIVNANGGTPPPSVPESGSLALLVIGLAGNLYMRRRNGVIGPVAI